MGRHFLLALLLQYFPACQPEMTRKLQSWTQEIGPGSGHLTHLAQPSPACEKISPASPPNPRPLGFLFCYLPSLLSSALEGKCIGPPTPCMHPENSVRYLWAESFLESKLLRGEGEGETSGATEGPGSLNPNKGQRKKSQRGREGKAKGGGMCDSLLRSGLAHMAGALTGTGTVYSDILGKLKYTHTHTPRNRSMELRERSRNVKTKRVRAQLRPERRKPWGSQGPGYL